MFFIMLEQFSQLKKLTHVEKMFHKKLSKYIQVGSSFENFIVRNTVVRSDFDLNIWFGKYNFFLFDFLLGHIPNLLLHTPHS